MNIWLIDIEDDKMILGWDKVEDADCYRLLWKDRKRDSMQFKELFQTAECRGFLKRCQGFPTMLRFRH